VPGPSPIDVTVTAPSATGIIHSRHRQHAIPRQPRSQPRQ
jgi:hypothetical protein